MDGGRVWEVFSETGIPTHPAARADEGTGPIELASGERALARSG